MNGADNHSRSDAARRGIRTESSPVKPSLPMARAGRLARSRHGAITDELSNWRDYSSWARNIRRHWDEGR
jgi:hypothetical protein